MTLYIILFVAACLIGIVFLSGGFRVKKITREEFLSALAKQVGGQVIPLEEFENAFKIEFVYDGHLCVYEDRESRGFREREFKGYLRVKTATPYSISLVEKEDRRTIRAERAPVAQNTQSSDTTAAPFILPKSLARFTYHTNNLDLTRSLFENKQVAQLFVDFANADTRGAVFNSLKVIDGEIILEFSEAGYFKPSRPILINQLSLLEKSAEKLMHLVKRIENLTT
ncbi:MAG: hypothetical protein HQL23_00535 [Candidatus Omnitrophica bacterium]|nr:hypothetical protein [Candidatus Omnitrophota bacterium]